MLEHQVWLELKATHLARMRLDWDALPSTTTASPPADHPFGNDFDLTGSGSLHHLLDTTVSQEASALLKTWLLEIAPDFAQIQDRQMLVQALVPLSTFRDKLTLKARLASTGLVTRWQGQGVLPWLNEASTASDLWPLGLGLGSLSLINLLLFGLYWLAILPPLWTASLVLYIGLTYLRWSEVTGYFI